MEDPDEHVCHRGESSRRSGVTGPTRIVRVYVGLGANLGDAGASIAAGIRALAALPNARLVGVSRLYRTAPWGVVDQPVFHNAVAGLDIRSSAKAADPDGTRGASHLLVALKALEHELGRQERQRWGPRELDLDLLVYGRSHFSINRPLAGRSADPTKAGMPLTVPHPEARNRLFVLAPLADLTPRLVPPAWHETIESARRRRVMAEGSDAAVPVARWAGGGWIPLGPRLSDQSAPR